MSKEFILGRVKAQINSDRADKTRKKAVNDRVSNHDTGILPEVPATRIKRLKHFIAKVEASQATLEQVSRKNLAKAVVEYLRAHNLPTEIRMGRDPRLDIIREQGGRLLTIRDGKSDGNDLVGVSHGEAGVVETGTLALFSGKDNPTTLNFLPENHIIVLNEKDICDHYEHVWSIVRKKFGTGNMPRALNFITGPSRSADIEQTLLLGAHGPIRLHVLLTRD